MKVKFVYLDFCKMHNSCCQVNKSKYSISALYYFTLHNIYDGIKFCAALMAEAMKQHSSDETDIQFSSLISDSENTERPENDSYQNNFLVD